MDIYQHLYLAFSVELSDEEIQELEEGMRENPYFSLQQILLAKGKQGNEDILRAAIYAPNRITLRDFMQGKLYFAEIQRQKQMQETTSVRLKCD